MLNRKNTREGDDEYSGVIAQITPRSRVVICHDRLQFIVQVRGGAAWRGRRFYSTRAALLAQLHEVVGDVAPDAMTLLARLPPFARDYRATHAPHAAPEVAELEVCPC
ncbi:hypothetical protein [Xanthobacter sp. 126]|uniref:hypothetical protein n=1 Tax=Xanthobacter sp. 126 TaxID=1131814 RepID=UPI00045E67C9|nr:hypothetical protein [Xanthobacter sp. 126]